MAAIYDAPSLEVPVAGFYECRLLRGAPPAGVKIFYGPPKDPVTGEIMDRSYRWQAEVNGGFVDFDRVWPKCVGTVLDEPEYKFRCELTRYALDFDAWDPHAQPNKAVDWSTATPPTF